VKPHGNHEVSNFVLIGIVTAFKQQQLRAWQPILTPFPVILSFLIVGIIFIPVGVALLIASNNVSYQTFKKYVHIRCNMFFLFFLQQKSNAVGSNNINTHFVPSR
jgi:hypothetical protein